MNLSAALNKLVSPGEYSNGNKTRVRWGQLLRASALLVEDESRLVESESLVTLDTLGHICGGIVTRANAYFLVQEILFDQIPARMRVTRGDLSRIAVTVDGLGHLAKIEREFLKPVIKGPDSLESALGIRRSNLRLFDVKDDKRTLENRHANGALTYLRRGETVNFKTSEDDLKGGIPALRSQVKNRKPFWYSLQGEHTATTRIVFPEHIDRRYVFTLVPQRDDSVVIDKLFLFEPKENKHAHLTHAALNSLFTWYQVELRGRSQLGEGVLELKIPDYAGLYIANPKGRGAKHYENALKLFSHLRAAGSGPSLAELGTPARRAFDLEYLRACEFKNPERTLLWLEQTLRALAGERAERKLSVADAKISRRKIVNVAASIDAYAARVAASIEPHPDPRSFIEPGTALETVSILGKVDGPLEIGVELFNQGEVLAGGTCIARAGNMLAAQFVMGVLLVQPDLSQVKVPTGKPLNHSMDEWTKESRRWHMKFESAAQKTLVGLEDLRMRSAIEERALRLLHAV